MKEFFANASCLKKTCPFQGITGYGFIALLIMQLLLSDFLITYLKQHYSIAIFPWITWCRHATKMFLFCFFSFLYLPQPAMIFL